MSSTGLDSSARQILFPLLRLTAGLLAASQALALLIFFGLVSQHESFLHQATPVEATLLGVSPEVSGYRVQVSYPIAGQTNRTSVLVPAPPSIRIGEKVQAYVDPANFWRVELAGPPPVSLAFLQAGCAAFALLFSFFAALGAIAAGGPPVVSPKTGEPIRLLPGKDRRGAG